VPLTLSRLVEELTDASPSLLRQTECYCYLLVNIIFAGPIPGDLNITKRTKCLAAHPSLVGRYR